MDNSFTSFVIVGKSPIRLAWQWDTWSRIAEILAPVIDASGHPAAVRSVQGAGPKNQNVRFGRLGWDQKSHQKWSHSSPLNSNTCGEWMFALTEVWCPAWTVCDRDQIEPSLFIGIENPFLTGAPKDGQYNQLFHLAVGPALHHSNQELVHKAVGEISALLEGVLTLVRQAPWLEQGDCIRSLLNNNVSYVGMRNDLVPDPAKMRAAWTDFEPNISG